MRGETSSSISAMLGALGLSIRRGRPPPCWKSGNPTGLKNIKLREIIKKVMPEMPRPGEHHGDAVVVGGLDHLVVAHRSRRAGSRRWRRLRSPPASRRRMGRTRRTRPPNLMVSGSFRPFGLCARPRRLARGDARGIDPAHLPGADADRGAVLGIDDGVRFHVLGDAEGETQVGEFGRWSARDWSRP